MRQGASSATRVGCSTLCARQRAWLCLAQGGCAPPHIPPARSHSRSPVPAPPHPNPQPPGPPQYLLLTAAFPAAGAAYFAAPKTTLFHTFGYAYGASPLGTGACACMQLSKRLGAPPLLSEVASRAGAWHAPLMVPSPCRQVHLHDVEGGGRRPHDRAPRHDLHFKGKKRTAGLPAGLLQAQPLAALAAAVHAPDPQGTA